MVAMTRESVRAVRELMENESVNGVRIYAGPRRLARKPSILVQLADAPDVEETVLEADGAFFYVDGETLKVLDDKVLDADLSGDEPRFAVLPQVEAQVRA
jgi:Fe-S cluster assembly iron-binding protein IscA